MKTTKEICDENGILGQIIWQRCENTFVRNSKYEDLVSLLWVMADFRDTRDEMGFWHMLERKAFNILKKSDSFSERKEQTIIFLSDNNGENT